MKNLIIMSMLLSMFSCHKQTTSKTLPEEDVVLTDKNMIYIRDEICPNTAKYVKDTLIHLSQVNPTTQLYLVINTLGGDWESMDQILDAVKQTPNPVATISLSSVSAGYFIVELVKGKRYITKKGFLLTHRWKYSLNGQMNFLQWKASLDLLEQDHQVFYKKIANRLDIPLESYLLMITNDYIVYADRAYSENHVDAIANISCDESLKGDEQYDILLKNQEYSITLPKCPLYNEIKGITPNDPFRDTYSYFYSRLIDRTVE